MPVWNHSKSLLLTAWWIRLALLGWLLIAAALPFFQLERAMLVLFYIVFLPVLAALYGMERMLRNIQQGIVFASANVGYLRLISWACFFFRSLFVGGRLSLAGFDFSSRLYRLFGLICASH